MTDMQINPGFKNMVFKVADYEKTPEYLAYRHAWEFNPVQGITSDMPLCLDIEISNRCNLKCKFCTREMMLKNGKKEGQGNMVWEDYMHIMAQIKDKVPSIKLNWRGEPTMHPLLVDMVKQAKRAGVIEVMFNTNGQLLSRELSQKLIEAGLDKIIFSIESIDPLRYKDPEHGRVGGELSTVVENIRALVEERGEKDRPAIRVQKIDFPELRSEPYLEFFKELGCDSVATNTFKEKDPEKCIEVIYKSCSQPWQRIFVAWTGNYYPCCQGQLFESIGNVRTMRVREAWHSSLMKFLRTSHGTGNGYQVEECSTCQTAKGV